MTIKILESGYSLRVKIITFLFGVFVINGSVLAAGIPDKIIDGVVGNVKSQEIIEMFNESSTTTLSKKVYSNLGYNTESEFTSSDGKKTTVKFNFSSSGYPLREYTTTNLLVSYLSCIFSYSLDSKLVDSTLYDPVGAVLSKTSYTYSADNRLVQERTSGEDRNLVRTNVYDSKGMLTQRFLYAKQNEISFISLVTSYKTDGLQSGQLSELKLGTYHSRNMYRCEYSEPDGKGNFAQKLTFKTDKMGNTVVSSISQIKTVYFD